MTRVEICFNHPWFLLLLIPAALLTFIPYLRIKKRYRRTRNRIISVVLHCIVMVLSIALLSGFYVRYYYPNNENEVILLVDVSDTNTAEERDAFIENVIEECSLENIRVGVVTFGFDQVYAVPLTRDYDEIFDEYKEADLPDVSATNLADALLYTATLFDNPETGKIVVVTDGKETDGESNNVISRTISDGLAVEVAYFPSDFTEIDAQILSIQMPDYYVAKDTECEIGVIIRCDEAVEAMVTLYDNPSKENPEAKVSEKHSLPMGEKTIFFDHKFEDYGVHEIKIVISVDGEDGWIYNNAYSTYYDLQNYNRILILESEPNTSTEIEKMLNGEAGKKEPYQITIMEIGATGMPTTCEALRAYDQVIMNNVAAMDLPDGFDKELKKYVEEYGGGLLTVGGSNVDGKPHIYNKNDKFTTYHSLFPVEADTYVPPIGVMFVVDQSGSMIAESDEGIKLIDAAKQGVAYAIETSLNERDYVGIMTLDSTHGSVLEMTPRTKLETIKKALEKLGTPSGSTFFRDSISAAGDALRSLEDVARRHIVIISDGITSDAAEGVGGYLNLVDNFYKNNGITISVVGVGTTAESKAAMEKLCEKAHGNFYKASSMQSFSDVLSEDLKTELIAESNEQAEPFYPLIYNPSSSLIQGLPRLEDNEKALDVTLKGFYGSRVKDGAELVLVSSDYEVPLYAQWTVGNGMVGSFMSDLQATTWSNTFTSSEVGKAFMTSVVNNLMPTKNIRYNEVTASLREDNYTNTLNIIPRLKEGERVEGTITQMLQGVEGESLSLTETTVDIEGRTFYVKQGITNNYTKCDFVVKESGVYKIELIKYDAENKQVGEKLVIYKSFAYSEEYDETMLLPESERKLLMADLAEKGGGALIEDEGDMEPVLKGFVTELVSVFDPRFSFMIAAIVLFLLDIAVCKFKFKWIHEIIRDRKRKNNL